MAERGVNIKFREKEKTKLSMYRHVGSDEMPSCESMQKLCPDNGYKCTI